MKRRQFIWYSLLALGGCTTRQFYDSLSLNSTSINQPEKLRFAVTDIQGLEKLEENYEPFRQALEVVLKTPIEFFPVESYIAATVALQSNQVDLVLTGPSEYVVINARTNAIPLIAISRKNYYSVIAISAQSSIQSLVDLKGKTISLKQIGSTSGHLGPTKLLIDAGLQPNIDYQVQMLGAKERAKALQTGTVDAWGGAITDYQAYLLTEGYSEQDFPILEKGMSLPNDLIVVNSLLSPDLINIYKQQIIEGQNQLLQALGSGEETHKYKEAQFVPTEDSDYDIIREVYQAMGAEKLIQ